MARPANSGAALQAPSPDRFPSPHHFTLNTRAVHVIPGDARLLELLQEAELHAEAAIALLNEQLDGLLKSPPRANSQCVAAAITLMSLARECSFAAFDFLGHYVTTGQVPPDHEDWRAEQAEASQQTEATAAPGETVSTAKRARRRRVKPKAA